MNFLTQLNSGCIDICKNMLESAKKVGLNLNNFYIACLDKSAYEQMKSYPNVFLYRDQDLTEYQEWSFDPNSNFRQIVKTKWKLIFDIYEQDNNLCWVDTDIVFKQNPVNFFNLNKNYILFQSDSPGSLICSGLMVFNNSKRCKSLITECSENEEEDDQILVNKIALTNYKNDIGLLPVEYFPNGHLYYVKGMKDKAFMVHNNHMVGIQTKIDKFKQEGLWYL